MSKRLAAVMMVLGATSLAHAEPEEALALSADPEAGAARASTCVACHGPAGISPLGAFPNLAGQQMAYLAKQIREIRDGERDVAQMAGLLDDYSDEDAWNVAAFYAAEAPEQGQADDVPEELARGETLYRAGDAAAGIPACSACHGPSGGGIGSAAYPALSGQHPDYTLHALDAFASGERDNDPDGVMGEIARRLNEADRQALANYLRGLH